MKIRVGLILPAPKESGFLRGAFRIYVISIKSVSVYNVDMTLC